MPFFNIAEEGGFIAKRGRKNKYETDVKAHFPKIIEWLENGATERQIAQNLGIGYSTFNRYKTEHVELQEIIKKGRRSVILKLRGALINKALGYTYTETKTVTVKAKLPMEIRVFLLESGFTEEQIAKSEVIKTEVMQRQSLPDVAALNLALKNYDPDNWANDPQSIKLKERELELREKQIEKDDW